MDSLYYPICVHYIKPLRVMPARTLIEWSTIFVMRTTRGLYLSSIDSNFFISFLLSELYRAYIYFMKIPYMQPFRP
jgi:hypothetical protein